MPEDTRAEPTAKPKVCPTCAEPFEADVLFCPKDGTPIPSKKRSSFRTAEDPYLGLDLAGQIRLRQLVGIGSMGRVYKGFQGGVERDVAVKILHRELSANKELVKRFHQEAKVASRLTQPNVVQVLMTGTVPVVNELRIGGEAYLVMEFLDGISLLTGLAACEGSLPLPRALRIMLQVCDAVGDAHAQGIVHRDIKPENIMLVRRGAEHDYVKVLDFGIARLDWTDRSISTQQGLIFGTAKYISPEGAEGRTVGPPADVYSLATVLFECLAGRTPFEGDSPVALLVQQTQATPPDLRSIPRAAYVPGPISELVMKNLGKDPALRSPDAHVFGRELVLAMRSAGLDPDELLSPTSSLLGRPGSVVRLASKERTRAMDFTPPRTAGEPPSDPELGERTAPPASRSARLPSPLAEAGVRPSSGRRASGTEVAAYARGSRPVDPLGPTALPPEPVESAPDALDALDHAFAASRPHELASMPQEDAGPSSDESGSGVDDPPVERPRRSGVVRVVAYGVGAAVAAAALVLLVLRFTHASAEPAGEAEALRDAMRRHAWIAPAGSSVRDIVKRAGSAPDVAELRETAASLVIADALGRKYAGALGEARDLCRLALELSPNNPTALRLLGEVDAAPVAAPSLSQSPWPSVPPPARTSTVAVRSPAPSGSPGPRAPASAKPTAPVPPPEAPTLMPPPPPTAPATGPWL